MIRKGLDSEKRSRSIKGIVFYLLCDVVNLSERQAEDELIPCRFLENEENKQQRFGNAEVFLLIFCCVSWRLLDLMSDGCLTAKFFCRIVAEKQKFLGARGKGVLRFAVLFLPAVEAKKRALEIKAGLTAEF